MSDPLESQWAECVKLAEQAYSYQWTERDRAWFADWFCGEGRILLCARLFRGETLDAVLRHFDEYAILLWGDKHFNKSLERVQHTGLRCAMNAFFYLLLERITAPDDDYLGEPTAGLVQTPVSVGRCVP